MARLKDWRLWAFVLLALVVAWGFLRINSVIDKQERERGERRAVACASEHREQLDVRDDAIENYLRIPPAARGTLVIAGITIHPRKELRHDLHGKYGNNRIPSYCPQNDWPEDERKWPAELKGGV